ncbi:hypothetical protein [Prosthecomicrobium hirschii]|uniref:hypothetical protein n=1 Tax=Prosthecodimorpha hirschii TaxID=665126 RepID=UPI00222051E5|nr:hypothetical protein [Prosthecomicrobium hirschii]MCW1841728.1 hypothetical protein [Prosthecomicrobium hirschii]
MSRLATSFVLGYHGCDEAVARKAVLDGARILHSDKDYDWLGPGAYFWESDPLRAKEWADRKVQTGQYKKASVIGAVIDLRNCLDLVSREDIELLQAAHSSFVAVQEKAGLPVPVNKDPKGAADRDRVLRFLDCAVLRHLHEIVEGAAKADPTIEPFDTVRGMFVEGGEAFPGSGFHAKSHVQIAVRNPACIKGLFYPLPPI